MAVDGVGQSNSTNNSAQTTTTKKTLGQDAFLQLLTTQLAHQDPTAPQDNGEMIAQMAQFSSLEQLTQIHTTLQAMSKAMGVDITAETSGTKSA